MKSIATTWQKMLLGYSRRHVKLDIIYVFYFFFFNMIIEMEKIKIYLIVSNLMNLIYEKLSTN